jgi:hypothetical protein
VLRHLRDFRSYQVIIEIIRLAGRLAVINVQEIYELMTAVGAKRPFVRNSIP